MRDTKPIAVDLFCGAGGMSLGFQQAGFQVLAAYDNNPRCVQAHSANLPECKAVQVDLATTNGKELRILGNLGRKDIHVLFGGPPCGGFSIAGQRNPSDPRNKLLLRFAQLIGELRPAYFAVENVRGLQVGKSTKVLDRFRKTTENAGYELAWPARILDASDFGVPQRRERIFLLGCRSGLPLPAYPEPMTAKGGNGRPTVADAIGDLAIIDENEERIDRDVYQGPLGAPSDYAQCLRACPDGTGRYDPKRARRHCRLTGCLRVAHSSAAVRRFRSTPVGTREPISQFYRLAYDGLSPTLRSGTDLEHGKFTAVRPIHPAYPRCITVREAARLHSIPDWFQFHPTKWHGFMQIGNAVPPLLARVVAESIRDATPFS